MNKLIEICEMCEEYMADEECEIKETCKINALVKENERLKKEVQSLKCDMSYMINPLAIGDRHEMGD